MNPRPVRSLAECAKQAILLQDACNLSGVAHFLAELCSDLRYHLPCASTEVINQHTLVRLTLYKMTDLAKMSQVHDCYSAWYQAAKTMAAADTDDDGVHCRWG